MNPIIPLKIYRAHIPMFYEPKPTERYWLRYRIRTSIKCSSNGVLIGLKGSPDT
jgi:hypothetical protein